LLETLPAAEQNSFHPVVETLKSEIADSIHAIESV